MSDLLILNANIITPQRTFTGAWLVSKNGKIAAVGTGSMPPARGQLLDAQGLTLVPGFIDVHVHGAMGADVMDCTPEALQTMADYFVRHGVTSFLATTLTAPHEQLCQALETIRQVMQSDYTGARILGAHLEGPYVNRSKGGAQDLEFIRRADREEATALLDMGVIRLLSVAPEYPENLWLIEECVQRGITASAAHTAATYKEMQRGIEHGISHATHTYNAMPSLNHREPGGMAALMLFDSVRCELIADNVHVHPAMMDLLYRIKGTEKLILISDAMRATGMTDGDYTLGRHEVMVKNGEARLADGTLAGSILTMDKALKNFQAATGASLEALWRTTSYNAAQSIHLGHQKGSIEIGKDADFALIDADFNVHATIIGGKIVYQA